MDEAPIASGVILLGATVYALIQQGAFFAIQLSVLEAAVVFAFVVAIRRHPPGVDDLHDPGTIAFAIVLVTTLVTATIDHNVLPALLLDLFLVTLLAAVLVARRLGSRERDALTWGVLAAASGVGIYGWLGVAFHWSPAALINGPLWRASTSITYANAGASVLMICALVALARCCIGDRMAKLAAFTCFVGLASTFSRGGALAFGAGVVVIAIASGFRRFVASTVAVFIGGAIAIAALLPSVPADKPSHPALAVVGLIVGSGLVMSSDVIGTRRVVISATALCLIAVAVLHGQLTGAWHAVAGTRIADDPAVQERVGRWGSFIATFRDDPVFGAGPGSFLLHYPGRGTFDVGRFAHNEYLQILAEQGVVGIAGLIAALAVLARGLWVRWSTDWIWAGAAATGVGFVVHGATDFVWNVPVVPLLAAILFGLSGPSRPMERRCERMSHDAPSSQPRPIP